MIERRIPETPAGYRPALMSLCRDLKAMVMLCGFGHGPLPPVSAFANVIGEWGRRAEAALLDEESGRTMSAQQAKGLFADLWPRVKYATGDGPLEQALADGRQERIDDRYPEDHRSEDIRRLCRALQRHANQTGDPKEKGCFFFTFRAIGDLLELDKMTARELVMGLEVDRVIERVENGRQGRASRYRLLEPLD